jgi:phosphate transport system permease protein
MAEKTIHYNELTDYLRGRTGKLVKRKNRTQKIAYTVLFLFLITVALLVFSIFTHIIVKGANELSIGFIFGTGDTGVFKALVGTFLVTIITAVFSVPIGVCTAIYLNEYAKQNKLNRIIRLAIRTLSGVPSVVYGLFGLILFLRIAHMPTSILAAGLTLGLMTLPWVITASEEALRSIPMGYREGSLALGASKWYTIRKNVLPYAISGIITGGIIGLARAAGETAPILFTGAASRAPLESFPKILMADFEALSYKIYYFASVDAQMFRFRGVVYGTCLVLLMLVLILMITAIIIRYRLRKKYRVL